MRRKKDDIAKFACLWYPQARKREMEALALYTTWLVCWDDAVDANEGDLAGDFARAERWRRQTLGAVHEALAVDGMCARGSDGDPINDVFRDFGSRISETASRDQRRILQDEIQLFTVSCAAEQELRLADHVPDYESYMKLRIGTVGGKMLCSLVPYATQERLPQAVLSSPEIHQLWKQVCVLLSLLNDLLSLKKELQTDCVINAVAAIMEPDMTLDMVVAELEVRMRTAVNEFDDAASKLINDTEVEGEVRPLVERYVEGCRSIVTGTLEFTFVYPWKIYIRRLLTFYRLTSPRYNIWKLVQQDGSLKITL
ncbi:hypothetical protein ACHAPO_004348 [Fusarium lateritium]